DLYAGDPRGRLRSRDLACGARATTGAHPGVRARPPRLPAPRGRGQGEGAQALCQLRAPSSNRDRVLSDTGTDRAPRSGHARRRAGHGARGAAGLSVERLHPEDGAVAARLLPAVFHRRYRVDGVFRSAYTTPRHRGDRDLPWLVGDTRRVRREQLRLRRDRHLDQGRSLKLLVVALLGLAACRSSRGERSASAAAGPAWLRERGAEEAVLAARSATVHDFQFAD